MNQSEISISCVNQSGLTWTVAVDELLEEAGAREPHPSAGVDGPVGVEEQLVKHPHPVLPGHPEVSPRQEAGRGVASQVVDPTLLPQLCRCDWLIHAVF